METTTKRLYKSRTERMIDGVCGGVAEYFGLDVTLVRIAWVLLTLLGGSGILLYIVAMIVMPANPVKGSVETPRSTNANSKFWGILLVTVGLFWLMDNLDMSFWHHMWWFRWDTLLPVVLILAGVAFIFGGRNYISNSTATAPVAPESPAEPVPPSPSPRLRKSRTEKKLFGVCGGIANYVNMDPTIIRILFVVAAFASFGFALLIYIAMAIIVPDEPLVTPAS